MKKLIKSVIKTYFFFFQELYNKKSRDDDLQLLKNNLKDVKDIMVENIGKMNNIEWSKRNP